jgi:glycosidase
MFKADPEKQGVNASWFLEESDRSDWNPVETPQYWEHYPGLATYDGWGWFAREFELAAVPDSLSLHFAGVDDDAVVWLNGREIGSHTGYSDPFAMNAGTALRKGRNTIVVLVQDHAGGGGIYRPITLIETRNLDSLLRGPFYGTTARVSADWVRNGVIYEVYLRSFSREGTFKSLERRLPELRDLGVTVLWLMPVHPVGVKNRKGSLGSPYAVQDYYGINPEFGTLDDFRSLVQSVHHHGMKLVIDLVANHTSWDSRLMKEHPEWFTRNDRGEIIPPNADWTDVADLDYSHRGLREYMMEMMVYWVREIGIDGFRCDVAELVPTDFWEEARKRLDAVKPVMMLSEGSIPEHHAAAFDITYAWNVYDALDPLLSGKRPPALLDQILRTESLQFPTGSLRMRFNTNHDKNAWDDPAVVKFGPDGVKLSAVLVNTLPGVPLIYTGEEVGNDRRLDLFEKVDVDWNRGNDLRAFYSSLARMRRENPSITRGTMTRLTTSAADRIYAFERTYGSSRTVVVLNFSRDSLTTRVSLPAAPGRTTMHDYFTGMEARAESNGTFSITLEPLGYRVFIIH